MGENPQGGDGGDAGDGEQGRDERPLPRLECDPSLIGRTLVGSGAPEPTPAWWRRVVQRERRGR